MLDMLLKVPGLCAANYNMLFEIIRYYNIPVHLNTALAAIADDATVTVKGQDGATFEIPADSVILSVGYVSSAPVAEQLKAAGMDESRIHVIGDAKKVSNLQGVINAAYDTAYAL